MPTIAINTLNNSPLEGQEFTFIIPKKMFTSRIIKIATVETTAFIKPTKKLLKTIRDAEKEKKSGKLKFYSKVEEIMDALK